MIDELLAILPLLPSILGVLQRCMQWIEQEVDASDEVLLAAMNDDGVWYTECRM